ncbi:MAG TPA: AAA family ATPase [Verrucomicrobiae bacterium]|nr:AAA family ATPase [Verrucomicrobiae bacterium]
MWVVEKIEISGGFLPGLSINIPPGLTCIIGARGSGKSTLAETVRFALCGISAAPKHCADLIQQIPPAGRWSQSPRSPMHRTATPSSAPSSRTRYCSHPTVGRSRR